MAASRLTLNFTQKLLEINLTNNVDFHARDAEKLILITLCCWKWLRENVQLECVAKFCYLDDDDDEVDGKSNVSILKIKLRSPDLVLPGRLSIRQHLGQLRSRASSSWEATSDVGLGCPSSDPRRTSLAKGAINSDWELG